jgi:hypothetical protein
MIRFPTLVPRTGALVTAALLCVAAANAGSGPEEKFLAANSVAMSRMMAGMDVKASGDVDKDFVAMMVPHHQGAIDMAQSELLYGHNEQLRRMAQEIIADQTQEIAAMHLAIGESPDKPEASGGSMGAMAMKKSSMSMHKEP